MTKSWDTYRAVICDLYADRTLAEVRQIMQRDYGFDASTRAYRGRLIRWGVRKYNTRRQDGTLSGDEDGEGSMSDAESPSPSQQPPARGHGGRTGHQQYPQAGGRRNERETGSYGSPMYSPGSSVHSPGAYSPDDSTHLPHINTGVSYSREPLTSAPDSAPYSIWNEPDTSPFSPAHPYGGGGGGGGGGGSAGLQVPYTTAGYAYASSPVGSPFEEQYGFSQQYPVSGGGYGSGMISHDSYGSLDDHTGGYGQYPSHDVHSPRSSTGSQHQYAVYGSSHQGSRRGHRDRTRG